jgi:hypothetical protein
MKFEALWIGPYIIEKFLGYNSYFLKDMKGTILLEKDFPHPMQSCREGLTLFPYVDLLSLINESRDKNKYFSTCTHLARYTSVYVGCSTTTRIHRDLCQKIKIKFWVSMS